MTTGSVIFLHGASSSGKSTIARRLQATIEQPFLHYSIDHLRDAGVWPWDRIRSGEITWTDIRSQYFDGFHRSLAGFVEAGNNIIVEHILDTPGWLGHLQQLLAGRDVFFVGVRCDLVVLNRREAARGDRPIGSAEADYRSIHAGIDYDCEVDTTGGDLDGLVAKLISAWRGRSSSGVFHKLKPELGKQ
jgi:chloramphenicol 3-O phosphotransferase